MQETTSISPVEKIYAARFGGLFSLQQNPDFKGRGEIIVNSGSNEIVFRANRRAFLSNRQTEISFLPIDIENLTAAGNCIRFDTRKGRSGRHRRPFIFWLENHSAVDALLPLFRGVHQSVNITSPEVTESVPQKPSLDYTSITAGLVCLNIAVFVFMAAFLQAGWFAVSDLLPYVLYGANNGAATSQGEWWRLLTSMFMHYGLPHLFFNMWALVSIGAQVERWVGRGLFLLAYFGTGIVGGLVSILVHGDKIWSVGASGAIFGLYGVFLGLLLRAGRTIPARTTQPLIASTLLFVGYNILYGITNTGIDLAAHLGGLVSGVFIGGLAALPLDPSQRQRVFRKNALHCGAAAVLMIGAAIALVPRFDTAAVEEYLFARISGEFVTKEQAYLDKYRFAQNRSSQGGADHRSDLIRVAAELKSFYRQWSTEVTGFHPASPNIASRKNELLAAMEKQTKQIDTDLARQAEMAAVKLIAEQVDIRIKSFDVRQVDEKNPALLYSLLRDLNEMGVQLDEVATSTPEATSAKALITMRIQSTQNAITDAVQKFENFSQLNGMVDEFNTGLQPYTKTFLEPGAMPTTAEAIAALEQRFIPFLEQWKTRIDQTTARSEPAAHLRSRLAAEVDEKLKKSTSLLVELRDSAMAERLKAITTDLTLNNEKFAERATRITGDFRRDAENRIKLITTEMIPFLDET